MSYTSYEQASHFEQRFWLQILGDHARFIHSAFAVEEGQEIQWAQRFISVFDSLLSRAGSDASLHQLLELNQATFHYAEELRSFKLHLLKRHLIGSITMNMSPTFLNHMVNEIEEALSLFQVLQKGQIPPLQDAIHHHLLWLQDAYGHSASISSDLDLTENRLKDKSDEFTHHFDHFYLKAVELAGYTRTELRSFPALERFNHSVELEMLLFRKFLHELLELGLSKEMLGTLMPLMADHMSREECYYLTKLSWVSSVEDPSCDPAKPRVED